MSDLEGNTLGAGGSLLTSEEREGAHLLPGHNQHVTRPLPSTHHLHLQVEQHNYPGMMRNRLIGTVGTYRTGKLRSDRYQISVPTLQVSTYGIRVCTKVPMLRYLRKKSTYSTKQWYVMGTYNN